MSASTLTLLVAGAANVLPALFFMFTVLLGSNGLNSTQGGKLLVAVAVLLALGWVAALWLARHLAHRCQARGWSAVASAAAASGGAVAAFTVMALLVTMAALLWVSA